MDGVRAYWSGSKLWSRYGNELDVTEEFTRGLPLFPLDGEIWMGRGNYGQLLGILRSKVNLMEYKDVGYYLFDLPGSTAPFEERYQQLKKLSLPSHVHIVNNIECENMKQFFTNLESVLEKGGEGLMLREPRSLYIVGATSSLLKVKVEISSFDTCSTICQQFEDTDVEVMEILDNGFYCKQYAFLI